MSCWFPAAALILWIVDKTAHLSMQYFHIVAGVLVSLGSHLMSTNLVYLLSKL